MGRPLGDPRMQFQTVVSPEPLVSGVPKICTVATFAHPRTVPDRNHSLETKKNKLIVVSNRLPVTLARDGDTWTAKASSGGLATAMEPILKETGGVWIGWP